MYVVFIDLFDDVAFCKRTRVVFWNTTVNTTNLNLIKMLLITNLHYLWFYQKIMMTWPLISADLSSLNFLFVWGFFNNVVCVSPVQVILETLMYKKRNFVKFTVKCLSCGYKVGFASMCAESQAEPNLNFYRVPTHF
jgi:hypothetical protein